jgi:hypothetical protein
VPVAVQVVVDGHETPSSTWLLLPPATGLGIGLGIGNIDHCVPSQRSAITTPKSADSPTAMQNTVETHDTQESAPNLLP